MNVSMQDGFNLGWKLASVLTRTMLAEDLRTYSDERRAIAKELIDFDREWAKMFSAPPKNPPTPKLGKASIPRSSRDILSSRALHAGTGNPLLVLDHLRPSRRISISRRFRHRHALSFGAGYQSGRCQADAAGSHGQGGRSLASLRFRPREDPVAPQSAVRTLCEFLANPPSLPIRKHTPAGEDIDSVIDVAQSFSRTIGHWHCTTCPRSFSPKRVVSGFVTTRRCSVPIRRAARTF